MQFRRSARWFGAALAVPLFACAGAWSAEAGGVSGFISDEAIAAWDKPNTGWKADVGPGVLVAPKYLGSSSYEASAIPIFDIEYKDLAFASFVDGVGLNVVNANGFTAGPVANWTFARHESDDYQHLRGLGDVPFTVEAGGFVAFEAGPFEARAELRQGIGGHDGMTGEISGSLNVPLTTKFAVGLGSNLKFADDDYMDAYFSVTAAQSAASGLARYDAGGGLVSAGLSAFGAYKLTQDFAVLAFGQYDRLIGDANASPIVAGNGGSKNQVYVGTGLTYAFKWN